MMRADAEGCTTWKLFEQDSIALASAAHHGQGAPSDRRLPTEASAGDGWGPWPREAASGSEGAEGEPRVRGEGAELPGARSGAELQDGRVSGHSRLDKLGITRPEQEKCARRQAWVVGLEEPTREHRTAKGPKAPGAPAERWRHRNTSRGSVGVVQATGAWSGAANQPSPCLWQRVIDDQLPGLRRPTRAQSGLRRKPVLPGLPRDQGTRATGKVPRSAC